MGRGGGIAKTEDERFGRRINTSPEARGGLDPPPAGRLVPDGGASGEESRRKPTPRGELDVGLRQAGPTASAAARSLRPAASTDCQSQGDCGANRRWTS